MAHATRRQFFQQSSRGLAAAGAMLILREDARATPVVADEHEASRVLIQMTAAPQSLPTKETFPKIVEIGYGPFYKPGAPFRAKLSQPGEPGTPFILTGRVWALDTRRPLPGTVLDFWHVDLKEKYSDGETDFRNRGRLVASETGQYELESIRPIPYRPNPNNQAFWRCAHFHFLALAPGYKPLVTEIHFHGDAHKDDPMYRLENAITPERRTLNGVTLETGVFDMVLERDTPAK